MTPPVADMSTNGSITVRHAQLDDPADRHAIVAMIDMYAREPFIDGKPLAAQIKDQLISDLALQAIGRHFLAFEGDAAVGVAVCFLGFSTFYARPLLNVHDLAVVSDYRGKGIGHRLLTAAESLAVELGCCKLTLEVRADNVAAQGLYHRFGFRCGEDASTKMEFWTKPLQTS